MTTAKAAPRTWMDNADQIRGGGNRMDRTWQDNADEFGRAERGEGTWYQAALIACSVFTGKATDKINTAAAVLGKVSTYEFAERAGVSPDTVARYFGAWPKAIAAGAEVPPTSDLGPDDVGSFPIPARPFNGPGGYVKTRVGGPNSTEAVLNKVATSAPALTKLVDAASPKVIAAVVAEMSDEAFENLTAAVAAVSTQPETPAVITKTGVTPAKKPSKAKQKATEKLSEKVEAEKTRKWMEERKKSAPPRSKPLPDGQVSPAMEAAQESLDSLKLYDVEYIGSFAAKVLETVLGHAGPLSELDEEYVVGELGRARDTIDRILAAVEAKKGSMVPDSVPDDWS